MEYRIQHDMETLCSRGLKKLGLYMGRKRMMLLILQPSAFVLGCDPVYNPSNWQLSSYRLLHIEHPRGILVKYVP